MRGTATDLTNAREAIRAATLADEAMLLDQLAGTARIDPGGRAVAAARAADLVRRVRATRPGLMETLLSEYGLSTDEGVALMTLAEALLRVPDAPTIDALIEDKIAPGDWSRHLGRSPSTLVNASTWALLLTGRVLDERGAGLGDVLKGAVRRLGEPVIRAAVGTAMRRLGRQFVLGETIADSLSRAASMEARGYAYSYDMLGEAARTWPDALRYRRAYETAIAAIATRAGTSDPRHNPGISIKLSALHPRYEAAQREACVPALVATATELARQAAAANLGFNIDAEEQDRLDLSLDIIAAVAGDPETRDWDGFGLVVQAYGRRALPVIRWVDALARDTGRRIMVRLVKGAYWDTEVKRAQVTGVASFPVLTRKAGTDISYLACARTLLGRTDRLFPQFATHNANTVANVIAMADGVARTGFEFQRLHGMGEALYDEVRRDEPDLAVRIYAPVGAHEDLLAYLVRRLLENGANSSFANRVVDATVAPEEVARDPFATLADGPSTNPAITPPPNLFGARRNSAGWDLADPVGLAAFEVARAPFRNTFWTAAPLVVGAPAGGASRDVASPTWASDHLGAVLDLDPAAASRVIEAARRSVGWAEPTERAAILRRAADLYEAHAGEFFALLAREAGKTAADAVGELREAVDGLRFYADEAERLAPEPAGVAVAISPWNFPLAIFTGQVAALLAAGNAVVAKPAEQTPLIACRAAHLLHEAGVPHGALQLAPGAGDVGQALVAVPGLAVIAFTGSLAVAKAIDRQLAQSSPDAILVAETGGINAMIVDSTALPEQVVRDAVASAFQSAGQRCSALRILYLQEDIAERVQAMLHGAIATLTQGDPWHLATDIGPVIDEDARAAIASYVAAAASDGRVEAQAGAAEGLFVPPTVIRVRGIGALREEVFGPVLHVATFRAGEIDRVVDDINAAGYGLTFALHTRIDARIEEVCARVHAGNIYVNRNQIGAVIGSQPFGGEGLSGTGPKAGGPHLVPRFARRAGGGPPAIADGAGSVPATAVMGAAVTRPAINGGAPTAMDQAGAIGAMDAADARLAPSASAASAAQSASAAPAAQGATGAPAAQTATGAHAATSASAATAAQSATGARAVTDNADGAGNNAPVLVAAGATEASRAMPVRHGATPVRAGGGTDATRVLTTVSPDAQPDASLHVSASSLNRAFAALPGPAAAVAVVALPGPVGEENRLTLVPRGRVICAGPSLFEAQAQAQAARDAGNAVLVIAPGASGAAALDGILDPATLTGLAGLAAVAWDGHDAGPIRRALAARDGPIVPLLASTDEFRIERHRSVDTTAAGGNAELLAAGDG